MVEFLPGTLVRIQETDELAIVVAAWSGSSHAISTGERYRVLRKSDGADNVELIVDAEQLEWVADPPSSG